MAINIRRLAFSETILQKAERNQTIMKLKVNEDVVKKFNEVKDSGQVISLSLNSATKSNAASTSGKTANINKNDTSYQLDSLFRTEMPKIKNSDGGYTVSGVSFTEEELTDARSMLADVTKELNSGGSLDYTDYAKMALSENAVDKYASEHFSKEQAEILSKGIREYNAGILELQDELMSRDNLVVNSDGRVSEYYGGNYKLESR